MNISEHLVGKARNERDLGLIDCPVLKHLSKNYLLNFVTQYVDQLDPTKELHMEELNSKIILNLEPLKESKFFDIYSVLSDKICHEFSIEPPTQFEIINILESHAFVYVAEFQLIVRRKSIRELLTKIEDFTEALNEVLNGMNSDSNHMQQILTMLSNDEKQSRIYSQATKSILDANTTLQTLPEFIRHSKIAKAVQLSKRSSVGNPALYKWVSAMYQIWVSVLGKSIENKNDGINGRKHLLEFLYTCSRPFHEALEYETLDNMLRKVQNDLSNTVN